MREISSRKRALNLSLEMTKNEPTKPGMLKVLAGDEAALKRPYIPLLSTQASWSDEETVAIYPNRWAVEVFFRRLKGDFGLQSGNQTRNFESNQAMISIAHIRYNFTLLAQAELFPDKTLSEVLQLMRLDAIYSDTIEDHLNTLLEFPRMIITEKPDKQAS